MTSDEQVKLWVDAIRAVFGIVYDEELKRLTVNDLQELGRICLAELEKKAA